jgi:hypothetical protein
VLSEVPAVLHSACGSKVVVSGDTTVLNSPPSVNGKVGVVLISQDPYFLY